MVRRRSTNDLFAIFPDLPSMPLRSTREQIARVHRQVRLQTEQTRQRAAESLLRQRAAAERVRAALSRRRKA
jgi:hypothetical protein